MKVLASDNEEALDLSLNVRQYLDKILAVYTKEFVPDRLSLHSRDDREASDIREIDLLSPSEKLLLPSEEIRDKALIILARLDGEVDLRDPLQLKSDDNLHSNGRGDPAKFSTATVLWAFG